MNRLRFYQDTVLFWVLILLFFAFSLPLVGSRTTLSCPLKVVRFHEPQEDGGLVKTVR